MLLIPTGRDEEEQANGGEHMGVLFQLGKIQGARQAAECNCEASSSVCELGFSSNIRIAF